MKGEFDRFFDQFDRPVEESQPDRFLSLIETVFLSVISTNYSTEYHLQVSSTARPKRSFRE